MSGSGNTNKNFVYNLLGQTTQVLVLFIITPYVSRVLGAKNIGIYSYTNSIVAYFVMFAAFGVSTWATREIASAHRAGNKELLIKVFWQAVVIKFFLVIIVIGVYIIFLLENREYIYIYRIQSLLIVNVFFDITWFFQGIEDFRKIAFRSITIKMVELFLIFFLVKAKVDFNLYIKICVWAELIGNLVLWVDVPKYISKIERIHIFEIFTGIKTMCSFFFLQVSIQINAVLDKTVLGYLGESVAENGFYEQTIKIVNVHRQFFYAYVIVIGVQLSGLFFERKEKDFYQLVKKAYKWILRLSCPAAVGLFIIADRFSVLFLGLEFEKVGLLLKIYIAVMLFQPVTSLFGNILVATKQQNRNAINVSCKIITNFILNIILIPHYKSVGAIIATTISEYIYFILQGFYVRQYIKLSDFVKTLGTYLTCALIMGGIISVVPRISLLANISVVWILLIQVGLGVFIYFVLLCFGVGEKKLLKEIISCFRRKGL